MAEKDIVFSGKISHNGLFDFKEFYTFCYDWLKDNNFHITESEYKEAIAGEAKNIEIVWDAKRKISDYFQFSIQMRWRILNMKKVKVKKEGKEVDTNNGMMTIGIKAVLIKDYEHRWEDQAIWKFLRGVYDRYIIRSRIEHYEDQLLAELEEYVSQCKAFLALEARR